MIYTLIRSLFSGASIQDILPGILFTIVVVLISLSMHEMSHAYAAYKMGDPTARNAGRLTMNPAKHLDLFGTVSMMLFGFGWAKPVPVNSRYFKNPRKGIIVTSVAGPLSNLLLSFVALLVFVLMGTFLPVPYAIGAYSSFTDKILYFTLLFLWYLHSLNLSLAVFNLLPIPPLDGSKILFMLLPHKAYFFIARYERYINLILIVLLFTGFLSTPLSYICDLISNGMTFIISLIPGI